METGFGTGHTLVSPAKAVEATRKVRASWPGWQSRILPEPDYSNWRGFVTATAPNSRVAGASKDPLVNVFEWTHKHFTKFQDCRLTYLRKALEEARFEIRKTLTKHMRIPVEIILGAKT